MTACGAVCERLMGLIVNNVHEQDLIGQSILARICRCYIHVHMLLYFIYYVVTDCLYFLMASPRLSLYSCHHDSIGIILDR